MLSAYCTHLCIYLTDEAVCSDISTVFHVQGRPWASWQLLDSGDGCRLADAHLPNCAYWKRAAWLTWLIPATDIPALQKGTNLVPQFPNACLVTNTICSTIGKVE